MSHNSDKDSPSDAISPVRTVAALCVAGRSIYKYLPGVEVFDRRRDARTFNANMPAAAHPPCRLWSKFLRHQAKSPDPEGERELGRWCVRTVMRCGGVVEQPAGSGLWADMGLPMPNQPAQDGVFTIYVEQGWFGFASRKPTWLLCCGVPISSIQIPFRFERASPISGLSAFGRSRSVTAFAEFLLGIARASSPGKAARAKSLALEGVAA